jgi:hypothetical protein
MSHKWEVDIADAVKAVKGDQEVAVTDRDVSGHGDFLAGAGRKWGRGRGNQQVLRNRQKRPD